MIAYHVDRNNALKEGNIIELTKDPIKDQTGLLCNFLPHDGLSNHGWHYLIDYKIQNTSGNKTEYYIMEYELELIRRAYFPNLISRFESFFAIPSIDEIDKWEGIFSENDTIWQIEFDESQSIIRDSNLLIPGLDLQTHMFAPISSFVNGYHYWSGVQSNNPRMELLIKPPIKIINQYHL